MKSVRYISQALLMALMLATTNLLRADGTNLLLVPSQPTSNPHQVNGWIFSSWNLKDDPSATGQVDGTSQADNDGTQTLSVTSNSSLKNLQMWWQSTNKIACSGGETYQLTVWIKGVLKSGTARTGVGLTFLDASGKWIGYQAIAQDPTIPADWQKIEGTVTVPENAKSIGMRLGVIFSDGDATVSFKNAALVPATP